MRRALPPIDLVDAGVPGSAVDALLEAERRRRDILVAELDDERARRRELEHSLARAKAKVARLQDTVASQRRSRTKLRKKIQAFAWRPGYARSPKYVAARRRFLEHCIDRGRLRRDGAVLDVGCGIGGVAEQLASYLDDQGRYEGFDVAPRAIEFARRIVGPSHPGFRFQVVDVWNSKYNPGGRHFPTDFRFPFDDDSFDLTILRSVFTHMPPAAVDHYLGEIARTLTPGGRCLITYMLLDDDSRSRPDVVDEAFPFDHGTHRLSDPDLVEARIALDENWVWSAYADHGLRIVEPVLYGSWRDPEDDDLDGQDLVTAEKPV